MKDGDVTLPSSMIRYNPEVQLDPSLSEMSKALYNYLQYRIQFFTMKELKFTESVETIARRLGWSATKVRRYLRELEERRLITITPRQYRTNIIKLTGDKDDFINICENLEK